MMKRSMMMIAVLLMAVVAYAQVEVNMEPLFHVTEKYIDLNEPSTVKDGVVFVGDTRTPDKIIDGKYKGMRVQKQSRFYRVGGQVVKYSNSLLFRRAPQGATKDHRVDVTLVPRSCMLQMRPVTGGRLSFCGITNKPEGNHIYVAVVNGSSFRVIASVPFTKGDEEYARKRNQPAEVKTCDYEYADGDELWIYSDGGINLHAFTFSGKIDKGFTGSDPIEFSKAMRRAQKK